MIKIVILVVCFLFTSISFSLDHCSHLSSSGDYLVIVDQEKSWSQSIPFKETLETYKKSIENYEGLRINLCLLEGSTSSQSVKSLLEPFRNELQMVMFIGDFKAPSVFSRETRSYNFESDPLDWTPTYYFYSDFETEFVQTQKDHWKCGKCTDQQILSEALFSIGIVRSFREDGKDVQRYLERVMEFRRGELSYEKKLFSARSGFDGLSVLQIFDDPEDGQSGYPAIAKSMGLSYKTSSPFSRIADREQWSSEKLQESKEIVRQGFRQKNTLFISLMHGNEKYAGGNSRVGPFLNSDIESQLVDGSLLSLFHSCSIGAEHSPKSLVYFDEEIGESSRLGIIAALVDTHYMSVMPNNVVLMSLGYRWGDVSRAVTNQMEVTYFGDPSLRVNTSSFDFADYRQKLVDTGFVYNSRTISNYCLLQKDHCLDDEPKLVNIALNNRRATMRASAINTLNKQSLLKQDVLEAFGGAVQDPHPLVRLVATKKLYGFGYQGVLVFDELNNVVSDQVNQLIVDQEEDEVDWVEFSDFIQW